ncbi:MAG TPA: zinc dependent phospholipase C family protein [Sediminibacterium sp.]|nr:zinc dependent phospholipase C family protein [Sediminibacterium sp.]
MPSFSKKLLPVICTVILSICGAWGFLVHRTVNQLAVYELPAEIAPFFSNHMDYLVRNAPRPDIRRSSDPTEAPKHFIDIEMYGPDALHKMPVHWKDAVARYTQDTLLKYGYVPYQIGMTVQALTRSFIAHNKDSILFYAADLGHYAGDANVPLHTTVNYDGQLTGQKGLHSLWESTIPALLESSYNLYSPHKASFVKDPELAAWIAVRRAAALLPALLSKEQELSQQFTDQEKYRVQMRKGKEYKSYTTAFVKAYAAALGNSVNEQLIHSADLTADLWYTAWVNAGKPDLSDINQGWGGEKEAAFEQELAAFRQNSLVKTGLLQALKQVPVANNE